MKLFQFEYKALVKLSKRKLFLTSDFVKDLRVTFFTTFEVNSR